MRPFAPTLACAAFLVAAPLLAQSIGTRTRCFDTDSLGNPTADTLDLRVETKLRQVGPTLAGQASRFWNDGEVLLVYGDTVVNGGCHAVSTRLYHWSPYDLVPSVWQLDSIPKYKAITFDAFAVGDQRRIVHAPPVLDPATLALTGSNYSTAAPETWHVNLRVEDSPFGPEYMQMVMFYDPVPGAPGEDITLVAKDPKTGKGEFGMGSSLGEYGELGLAPGAAWNNHLLAAASGLGAELDRVRIQPADVAPPIVRTFTAGPLSPYARGVVPVLLRDWHKDPQYRPDTLRSYEQQLGWAANTDTDLWSGGVATLSFNIDNVGIDTLRMWVSDHRQTLVTDSLTLTAMGLRGFQRRVVLGGILQNPRAAYSRAVTFTTTAQGAAAADPTGLFPNTPRWRLGNDVLLARVRPLGLRDVRFVTWDSRQLSDSIRIVMDSRGLRVNLLAFTTQDPDGADRTRRYGRVACDSGGCGGLDGWTFSGVYSQATPLVPGAVARFPQVVAGTDGVDFQVDAVLAPRDAAHAGDIQWAFGGPGDFGLVTASGASTRLQGGEYPEQNTAWGLNFLRATVQLDDTLWLSESRPVNLFFPRDVRKLSPGLLSPRVPNWFAYWTQAARLEPYIVQPEFTLEWKEHNPWRIPDAAAVFDQSSFGRRSGTIVVYDRLHLRGATAPITQYPGYPGSIPPAPTTAPLFETWMRCDGAALGTIGVNGATRDERVRAQQNAAAFRAAWVNTGGYCVAPAATPWRVLSGIEKFATVVAHENGHGQFYLDALTWSRQNGCENYGFGQCSTRSPGDGFVLDDAAYPLHYMWRSPSGIAAGCALIFSDGDADDFDPAVYNQCWPRLRRFDEFQADMRIAFIPADVLDRMRRRDWAYPGFQYVP